MRLKQIHGVAVENLPTGDGQNFDPAKFKLLLNHRKLELQGSQQSFPFLGGLNPAAFSALGARELGGPESGLDLRFKTIDDDLDEEMSEADSDKKPDDAEDKNDEQKSPCPRSRRKPAAPQWVNPGWEGGAGAGAGDAASQEPINGVCVRNMAAFGEENSENIAEDETSWMLLPQNKISFKNFFLIAKANQTTSDQPRRYLIRGGRSCDIRSPDPAQRQPHGGRRAAAAPL